MRYKRTIPLEKVGSVPNDGFWLAFVLSCTAALAVLGFR